MTGQPEDRPSSAAVTRRAGTEILLVLGLSLGASALYSLLSIISRLLSTQRLSDQQANLNTGQYPGQSTIDLISQLLGIGLNLVPVALALFLMGLDRWPGKAALGEPILLPPRVRIGFDLRCPGRDLLTGAGLAALIGIPGLGLYLVAHALNINTTVVPESLGAHWWTVPVLVLSAAENAVLEEVVVVGFLLTRLQAMRVPAWAAVVISALLRGSYHLYQGFGGFAGNVVMGIVFALVYKRWGRVAPLVVAHTILDVVSFVGYALLAGHVSWLPQP